MTETLYSLSTALQTAIDGGYTIDEETGEILWSPNQVDELEVSLQDKAEACAVVLKSKKAFAQDIKDEIDALDKRLKTLQRQIARMEDYVLRCVEINGEAIETPKCRLGTRKSTVLEVLDEGKIPSMYIKRTVTEKPDKIMIKQALKDGKTVPGCALMVVNHLAVK